MEMKTVSDNADDNNDDKAGVLLHHENDGDSPYPAVIPSIKLFVVTLSQNMLLSKAVIIRALPN